MESIWDNVEDSFTEWNELLETEDLEQGLALEREAELESAIEQDEHPRNYDAELESEREEAAPVSAKRLKREIKAEAIRRLEAAARTESDFAAVLDEWDRLDRNRERRERDHEHLRGDIPLEYQAVPEPTILPAWMNAPDVRALVSGDFPNIIYDCPYEMHNLTADPFISHMIESLSEDRKEVLFYLSLRLYSTAKAAAIRGQTDRNIRKLRTAIHKNLQRQMYEHLCAQDRSLSLREKQFLDEYARLSEQMGPGAVIRRENKTGPRREKTVPGDALDG